MMCTPACRRRVQNRNVPQPIDACAASRSDAPSTRTFVDCARGSHSSDSIAGLGRSSPSIRSPVSGEDAFRPQARFFRAKGITAFAVTHHAQAFQSQLRLCCKTAGQLLGCLLLQTEAAVFWLEICLWLADLFVAGGGPDAASLPPKLAHQWKHARDKGAGNLGAVLTLNLVLRWV